MTSFSEYNEFGRRYAAVETLRLAVCGALLAQCEGYPASLKEKLDGLGEPDTFIGGYEAIIEELGRLEQHHQDDENMSVEELCLPEGYEKHVRFAAAQLISVIQAGQVFGRISDEVAAMPIPPDLTPGQIFGELKHKLETLSRALYYV